MYAQNKYCLDANVLITAWYSMYPIDLFPDLWELLASNKNQLVIPKNIYNEIKPYSSSSKNENKDTLLDWMEEKEIRPEKVSDVPSNLIDTIALKMEKKYNTNDIGKGANKNDIYLIAFTMKHGYKLVTLEAIQREKPKEVKNYKIPLICQEESINCINFIEFLRHLKSSSSENNS